MYLIHTKYTLDIVGEETNEMTPEEANGITQAHIAIDKKITYEEVSSIVISNMGMRMWEQVSYCSSGKEEFLHLVKK